MKYKFPALTTFIALIFFGIFALLAKPAYAADYQTCIAGQNCTIGEFLYDDNSAPNATASCAITSKNPDGSVLLNAVTATANSSAWYSYSITASTTEGIYPTQICCTTTSDYLCLDKTFEVKTDTAKSVWEYSSRSLTSFGNLVADVWNYNTRSLSSFGTLVSDMWSGSNRTLSSTASTTVSSNDLKEIKKVVKENRVLLEQLINKPIVKTFIDDLNSPSLVSKLEQTKTTASILFGNTQNLKTRITLLSEKWPSLSDKEARAELSTISQIFKDDTTQKNSNLLANTNWLKTSWNNQIFLNLSDQSIAAQSKVDNLINDLNLYGKKNKSVTLESVIENIDAIDKLIGTPLATAEDLSVFGFIKKTQERVSLLDSKIKEGQALLSQIKTNTSNDYSADISKYSENVVSINQITKTDPFLIRTSKNTNTSTNKVLGLLALLDTNKLVLGSNTSAAIKNIWLEEGSIVFRAVATNPSKTISQDVNVKFYLPTEVKKEQIIEHDPALIIDYDATENALLATGDVNLLPEETRTFVVEVEDIWSFRQEEIDSLKLQANDLLASLKNTQYYTEGISTKTDIIVALDKIMLRQQQAITPENRIKTFRESSLELSSVEEKINSLKELVALSRTTGGLMGFVGGVQTVSLWGLVLVIVAGFVFLAMYMKALRSEIKTAPEGTIKLRDEEKGIFHKIKSISYRHKDKPPHTGHKIIKIAVIILITGGISSTAFASAYRLYQKSITLAQGPNNSKVLGAETEKVFPINSELKLPKTSYIPVHSSPAFTANQIASFKENQNIKIFKIVDDWAQVGLTEEDQNKNWWVNRIYLKF